MYLWKCWLEYRRVALILFVMTFGSICYVDYAVVSQPQLVNNGEGRTVLLEPGLGRFHKQEMQTAAIEEMKSIHCGWLVLAGLLAAICAGAGGGIGREYDGKTSELLFTRPRSRRSLLWMNWLSGMLILEAISLVPLVTWLAFRLAVTHSIGDGALFQTLLMWLPINMLLFGISLCSGVRLRSAPAGTVCSLAVIFWYGVTVTVLRAHFGLQTPGWWFDKLYGQFPYGHSQFPLGICSLWIAIALLFPYVTQKVLELRDIA